MKNSIHGVLMGYTRRNNSVNGNPAYSLDIEIDGRIEHFLSSSDSAFCYEVTNHRTPCAVEFTLTRSGRINYMKWSS